MRRAAVVGSIVPADEKAADTDMTIDAPPIDEAAAPATPAVAPLLAPLIGPPESHLRAVTKAVTWRIIGTLDTFLWSWLITGHPIAAGAIASMETFTKIGLFYLHERLWRLIRVAPHARWRSLVKAVSWRLVGSLDTFILSLIVTRNAGHAASIASVEALTKIILYYLHERGWRRIAWGRLDAPKS
jgi:uncharacterized membrane protein